MSDKNNGDGDKICGTCAYCTDLKDQKTGIVDTEKGICRRHPPQIVVITIRPSINLPNGQKAPAVQMAQGMSPHVIFSAPACGEWKEKKK